MNISSTTRITDGIRPNPQRRSRTTTGTSAKLSRIASATGIRMSWPKYSAPTTTTMIPRVVPVEVGGAAEGTAT